MTKSDEDPDAVAHALSRVASETVRITGLVEDLLLLARLDSGGRWSANRLTSRVWRSTRSATRTSPDRITNGSSTA